MELRVEQKSSFQFEPLPDALKADINRKYLSWAKFRKPFRVVTQSGSRLEQLSFIEDIGEMARNCDIGAPQKVTSHRRLLGPMIIHAKQTLMAIAKPLIHICLSRQIVFNDYTLALAQRVAFLEDRIRRLELELAKRAPESDRQP